MRHEWTAEQRRMLTVGCSVVAEGERAVVTRGPSVVASVGEFSFGAAGLVIYSGDADPSTVRMPSLSWLRKMARRKGVRVERYNDYTDPALYVYRGDEWLGTLPIGDKRHCAIFLDALPEVET